MLVDKAVSRQDYDDATAAAMEQAQAEIEYWKAAVEAARINLGYTRVTAPISGRIGKSSVTDGALVTAYQPATLATIQQLDPIYVDVTQSSAELLRLKRNLEAGRLTSDDGKTEKSPAYFWKTEHRIPRRGTCNSAMSRWTRRPGLSPCVSWSRIRNICSCRACSCGPLYRRASPNRPSWSRSRG